MMNKEGHTKIVNFMTPVVGGAGAGGMIKTMQDWRRVTIYCISNVIVLRGYDTFYTSAIVGPIYSTMGLLICNMNPSDKKSVLSL